MASRGRPFKEPNVITVKEFIAMVKFIKDHPVDRTQKRRSDDMPIPDTGVAYWREAMDQVLDCLSYVDRTTPMTSAKMVLHEKKINRYSDDRVVIYEFVRTNIIEKHGGSNKIYERDS